MQRLDRLERVTDLLLVLLDTPRPLSLREIANRVPGYPDAHGARRQAFERDKRLLRDEGVPVLVVEIDGDEQLGYRVDPDAYYLPDLGLEAEEQAALNLAVAGVHLGEPIGRQALLKLGTGGESPRRDTPVPLVDLPSFGGLPALPALFDAIRQTARGRLRLPGRAPAGGRGRAPVPPGHWYLVGFDRDRGEARTFRVDRIDGLPELGPPGSAQLPDDFDIDGAFARDPWQFGAGEAVEVDVLVDGAEAGRVVAELGEEAVVERGEDGAVVVRLPVTDAGALVLWVLDLLDHAEVIRPPEVRAAVVDRLQASAGACRPGSGDDRGRRHRGPPATAAGHPGLVGPGRGGIHRRDGARFDLTPDALVTELEMAACCGVPPYTPDQLMEIVVTDSTVSVRVGTSLARPRRLSPSEGFALATSARALLAVPGSDESGALSPALAKLDRALGGEEIASAWSWTRRPCSPWSGALADRRPLRISYYSASTDRVTEREIAPLRLFASEGHWYVDAWCQLAGDLRRFRVDRINAAEVLDDGVPARGGARGRAGDGRWCRRLDRPGLDGEERRCGRSGVPADGRLRARARTADGCASPSIPPPPGWWSPCPPPGRPPTGGRPDRGRAVRGRRRLAGAAPAPPGPRRPGARPPRVPGPGRRSRRPGPATL